MVVLDEPSNYLDRESLGALSTALSEFGGGVVVISHSKGARLLLGCRCCRVCAPSVPADAVCNGLRLRGSLCGSRLLILGLPPDV